MGLAVVTVVLKLVAIARVSTHFNASLVDAVLVMQSRPCSTMTPRPIIGRHLHEEKVSKSLLARVEIYVLHAAVFGRQC